MLKTSLIQLRVGDKVIYEPKGRAIEMTIIDYMIVPNGINSPELRCVIKAEAQGLTIEATSDKFVAVETEDYRNCYFKFTEK